MVPLSLLPPFVGHTIEVAIGGSDQAAHRIASIRFRIELVKCSYCTRGCHLEDGAGIVCAGQLCHAVEVSIRSQQ
jgi:hypothetical protein